MNIEEIKAKYALDAVGAGVVNPDYGMKTNVENRLSLKRRGNGKVMTISQYGKPARVSLKNVGGKFVLFNSNGEKLSKPFDSQKEAEDFARKGNWIITGRISKDSVSVNDKYDLGLNVNKNVPNAPIKVLTVTTKKEQDGVSGTVKFSKGGKNYAERFMVYSSGNWDVKPISNPGMNYSSGDREALMNAVRNKLSALGIKAK